MSRLLALVLAACLAGSAYAGNACEEIPPTQEKFSQSMQLAEMTYKELDNSGAQVAFVARVGQNLSRYGLRYSHMAFVWRDHPEGRWLVVHELNACGTASSALFNEGLGNFFMDVHRNEARIFIPTARTQQQLADILSGSMPSQLHSANYNMLAFPFSQQYQNSNQWLLETYAAAVSGERIDNRAKAQAWLRLADYRPITVEISAMTRLGARLSRANIAFDDHPFDRRMAGHIDTVSVESVLRFLRQREPEGRDITLTLSPQARL
jgi:hypothetical protein